MIEEKWYVTLVNYVMITIGVVMMGVALNMFFAPNSLAPGGVTGFAVVIEQLTGIPIYLTNIVINIPLFLFGARLLGKRVAVRTLYATILLTLLLKYIPAGPVTDDLLLSAVFGGLLNGTGLGIVFRSEGTTGGTDLAGVIMNKIFPRFKLSTFMMLIDFLVITLAGLVSQKAEIALYSMIAMYVTTKLVDVILEGLNYSKAFYIITNYTDEVSEALMEELERGVTALKGKGMYTKKERDVLLCVVSRAQFTTAKEIVRNVDENAFIMVTEMTEVLGEGFLMNK